jgi:hypothetical protein
MNYTNDDVVRLLELPDRGASKEDWNIISSIIKECFISDKDKWLLVRKPNNIYEYALLYPHIRIDGYMRIFLHYNKTN